MEPILQRHIPYDPFAVRKLPGIQPLAMQDWLLPDDAYAAQMGLRDQLLEQCRDKVLQLDQGAMAPAQELLRMVLDQLYPGNEQAILRQDETMVDVDWQDPLGTLGRITQQDFCILEKRGDEHMMTGAVLCFPASWTLSEKFMAPLTGIHAPVASYDDSIAVRVQRLFDGVQAGRPLWRFNALWYQDPALHQPHSHYDVRDETHDASAEFMRSEKQMILRLPETRAVVFCIHTYVLARADVQAQWGEPQAV